MADDDDLDMGDDGDASAPKKGGGGGGFLPTLLKFIALGLGAVILIVTVVIVTMKIMGGNTSQQMAVPVTEEYSATRELLDWYTSLGSLRTKTSDAIPASVVVDVVLE